MSEVIYKDRDYLLTKNEFSYKGTKEPIQNVKGLRLVTNDTRRKLINGAVGAFIMLVISLMFVPFLSIFTAVEALPLWIVKYVLPAVTVFIGFTYKYLQTTRFELEIEKSSGNKGVIGRSNAKDVFESLIENFSAAKKGITGKV